MSLFNSGVRPAIDQWLLEKAKEERDYGDYWSASQAGYCMRKVIFERLKVPKIEQEGDARKQRVFTSGHLFHDWIQGITKKAGLSIAQELELEDTSLMIRGHIDDLVLVDKNLHEGIPDSHIHIEKHLILYDYKTQNSRAFLWAKKNGNTMSYYHKMQLGTYMYMLRKFGIGNLKDREDGKLAQGSTGDNAKLGKTLTEARILKIEKDTLMMSEQQLIWSDELEKEVVSYWTKLNDWWKRKKIPPCTCHEQENGFLAKEAYNGYYYEGEPCSLEWMKKTKEEGLWQHPDAKQ